MGGGGGASSACNTATPRKPHGLRRPGAPPGRAHLHELPRGPVPDDGEPPSAPPRDANPRGTHPGPRGHSLETPSHVGLCPREHRKAEPADGDRAYLRGPRYRADRTSAESLKLTKKVKTPVSVSVFALAPGKPFSNEK